ncbi:MAG: type VI secretion system protein TssA [Candidatus Eisenbacteria bacterium]|uniref:Type VI secretion system protein TssA n=1 Tax=Eiseniibacteriota bacterium TaxID=2212470 RepID=A0A948S035_UNCEI|nr:type VI secretion system protein TssA [Candidatus Eisenbacteria bacterium]MBU1948378.1 type VI secretion system protein TssA [Candidatus Eisenbacteria bacterium]MBU2692833.1 type VI secretion system protein TssA [Candidatus Eisenbacteria bacterium]
MELSELREIGAKPISGDNPAGDGCRDEPTFELLQGEMRSLELPDASPPDWPKVLQYCNDLLTQKAKDLLVAVYLTVGLIHTYRYTGLITGLQILLDMIKEHWDGLHPEKKRIRGRIAALEYLSERGGQGFKRLQPTVADAEIIEEARRLLEEVQGVLAEKIEGSGPFLTEIQSALNEAATKAARPEPKPAAPTSSTAGQAAAMQAGTEAVPGTASSPPPGEIASEESAGRALNTIRQTARSIADYYMAHDPTNPLAYRLPRCLAWMEVTGLPTHTGDQTHLPGFQPPDFLDRLQESLDRGQCKTVLDEAEGRFPSAILWLDLNRFTAEALEGLGEDYYPAAEAVRQEVGSLLRRLPGLIALKFRSGQPLANDETQRWIRTRIQTAAQGDGPSVEAPLASVSLADEDDTGAFKVGREEARSLARQKKLAEAVRLLEDGARKAGSFKARVLWRLEAAFLCMEKKHEETALAILESLDEAMRNSTIADWDRTLYLDVVKSLYLCHTKVVSAMRQPPPDAATRSQEILTRLCRVDPATALALEGKK